MLRCCTPGLLVLAVIVAGSYGCRLAEDEPVDEQVLETVDIGGDPDRYIRPEDDPQAEIREEGIVGVLPGDFPDDLWAYEPSSILDFGEAGRGRRYVVLKTLASVPGAAERMASELQARGWEQSRSEETSASYVKNWRLVELDLEAKGNETWIRIEYPPG